MKKQLIKSLRTCLPAAGRTGFLLPLLFSLLFVFSLHAIQRDPERRNGNGDDLPPLQEASADTLEPNNSPDSAAQLAWGSGSTKNEAVSGPVTIANGLDFDFFSVQLTAGDSMSAVADVDEDAPDPLQPQISIMDSAGTVLADDLLSPGVASTAALYSGKYLILVTDRSFMEGEPFGGEGREYELILSRLLRRGDIDGSGELDYRDAFLTFMLVSGLLDSESVEPGALRAADVDGDGTVVGDMEDFYLLMDRVSYVPVRDPGSSRKRKGGGETLLALSDGSVIELSPGGTIRVAAPGSLADSAIALWRGGDSRPSPPQASTLLSLGQNRPNPLNPSTTISFSLGTQARIELALYGIRGRLVRMLASGEYCSGEHRVQWDGTDSMGRRVASGVYFYRLVAGDFVLTRKLVVVK